MTSEWVKWGEVEDEPVFERTVEDHGGYRIETQKALFDPNRPKPASIEESIKKAKEAHRRLFEESRATTGFAPTAVVIDPEGLWTAICCPDWADMREDGRREIHKIALRERAVAIIWGSDSYYLQGDIKDIDPEDWTNLPRPSTSPDRKEAFILTTIWPDGSAEMEMYEYKVEGKKLVWDPKGNIAPDAKCEQRICPAWAPSIGVIQ